MNIQLIQGQFPARDAVAIITEMINVKVKYHESKILSTSNEEDIKHRETKIKQLQKELFEANKDLITRSKDLKIETIIRIEEAH